MRSRGRRSAAELSVVPQITQELPDPPGELTSDEAKEWRAIVERMPPGWFNRENYPLLVQYCRSIIRARTVAKMANKLQKSPDTEEVRSEYLRLVDKEQRLNTNIASLATKMRLSQQSSYDKTKVRRAAAQRKPWDVSVA